MKSIRICLSVAELDSAFEEMVSKLSAIAEIDTVGLSFFSLSGYDIFIGKKLTKEALDGADRLKAVFAYKTGVDDFPIDALYERGIVLVNSHIDADYIAEYAMALSFALTSRIIECDKKLRRGIWYDIQNPYWKSIYSMKFGLLGYGHIGQAIHGMLMQNNIPAATLDRGRQYCNIEALPSLERLCDECDIIIASLPKTEKTDDLFDKEMLSHLKGKYIVNVGRSNCINEEALYEALRDGELAGAAIDTWDEKPKSKNQVLAPSKYPLSELDNVILSPHRAMFVSDGHLRYVRDITRKVSDYILDGTVSDTVDLKKGY
ncbi:MAG: hypothetical protein IJA52_07075 [Clostridia bacterium]|nr:hypothetical protein [Clostridia bacterium]